MSQGSLSRRERSALRDRFGERLEVRVELAPFTSSRIGGPADFALTATSADELADWATQLWDLEIPFRILGGGTNVLIADEGMRGMVILNRARGVEIRNEGGPEVWAESGASFGGVARRVTGRGYSGLEWAATIPGTVGGAVVGNAGAHGGDVASHLKVAEILHRDKGVVEHGPGELGFAYRESDLKRNPGNAVVLSATFGLSREAEGMAESRMREYVEHRRRTQPGGATWGSMFKNPPGDYAGRLIEAAGLKGYRVGDAQVSELHANFFVNQGNARAGEVAELLRTVRDEVRDKFDVKLELEIELIGDWGANHLEGEGLKGRGDG